LGEIGEAVAAVRETSPVPILLLHCTSGYPTPPEDCDLRTIPHLAQCFGVHAGLSDHTLGIVAPVAAVALGAVAIEKHFILSRSDGGVDSAFSLEPAEFKAMTEACRTAWAALGGIDYTIKESEKGGRSYRRSLYVVTDVAAGAALSTANIRSIRPGFGLPPKHLDEVVGRRATRALRRGEPLDWSMVGPA
jgi:N-acetylneuraminate synthase